MNKALKQKRKAVPFSLIENHLDSASAGAICETSALLAAAAATPRGEVPRSVSMALSPTPFSLLAHPEVSE